MESYIIQITINLSSENRAFKYGDAIFETVKVIHHKVFFGKIIILD